MKKMHVEITWGEEQKLQWIKIDGKKVRFPQLWLLYLKASAFVLGHPVPRP